MAIRTVITRGYGNGTFDGSIALVVTRGYAVAAEVVGLGPVETSLVHQHRGRFLVGALVALLSRR